MADENVGIQSTPGPIVQFPITTGLEFTEWPTEETLGMVYGVIVRSVGLARNIVAFFRNLAGGEVKQYTRLVEDSRRHALDRMIENAKVLGADGIISTRFDSSEMGTSMTEIVAYGTAVRFGPQGITARGGQRREWVDHPTYRRRGPYRFRHRQRLRPSPRGVRSATARLAADERGLQRPGLRSDHAGLGG